MPKIGDIKKSGCHKFIWVACLDCQKERWVVLRKGQPQSARCRNCSPKHRPPTFGERSPRFKTGFKIDKNGYKCVRIYPDNFFYPMAPKNGYVREHRLVVAKALGRCLHAWELVHHKHTKYPAGSNEDKQDNRIENLQLVSDDRHNQITILETKIKNLERQNKILKTEIGELKGADHKALNKVLQANR